MKIQFDKVLMSMAAFKELQELKLPPSLSLQVYKLGKELDREMEAYRELTKQIYKNHGIPETPTGFDLKEVDKDTFKKISEELDELLEQEMEIKDYHIPFETFERFNLPISTNLLIALEWLVKPEGEVKQEEPRGKGIYTDPN
jgi:hypothetical protein